MKVNKKLFEKPKKGPFNKPMFFKTIKEGFEYFAKFNKPIKNGKNKTNR